MPGLLQHLLNCERIDPGSTADSEKAEDIRLWLPSSLTKADHERICVPGLAAAEEKLQTAQCHDSLANIRDTLRLKLQMIQFKNKNIRGQRQGTRSRELINRVHNRARKFASMYRSARAAKLELSGPGKWEEVLQVLHDSDICSNQDPERTTVRRRRPGTLEDSEEPADMDIDEDDGDDGDGIDLLPEKRRKRDGTGRTRMSISWIWTVTSYNSEEPEAAMDDILRAEWAQSYARVHCATEEVELLREEMRRVIPFLDWKANWWSAKQNSRAVNDVTLAEGLRAYAVDQKLCQLALKASFQAIWKTPLNEAIADDENPMNEDRPEENSDDDDALEENEGQEEDEDNEDGRDEEKDDNGSNYNEPEENGGNQDQDEDMD